MGSSQRGTTYQIIKTNKTGSKVTVSTHKGAEITSTNPQHGHGSIAASAVRSATISTNPPIHRRLEPAYSTIPRDYHRPSLTLAGASSYGATVPKGAESRSKSEVYSTLPRKIHQSQPSPSYAVPTQRNSSPTREESPHRKGENRARHDSKHYAEYTVAKPVHRLSFADQRDNPQILQEDPPSKVQNPQGVRVPRRTLVCPKDEAVQTEPFQKSVTAAEGKSPKKRSSPERSRIYADSRTAQKKIPDQDSETGYYSRTYADSRTAQKKIPDQDSETGYYSRTYADSRTAQKKIPYQDSETGYYSRTYADSRTAQRRIPDQDLETGHYNSVYIEPKPLSKNKNLESLRLSVLKDMNGGHRVSMRVEPKSVQKHPAYTEAKPSPKVAMSSEAEANVKSPVRGDNEVSRRVTIYAGLQPTQPAHHVPPQTGSECLLKSSMSPEHVCKHRAQSPSENICKSPGPSPSRAKVELTPRPLPPRSLPRYGPDCSWWALLNNDVEMTQSRPTTPDFKPKSPPPVDYSLSCFEMDSSPFYEDLLLQREKASPPPLQSPKEPPSRAPLREVPRAPKHSSKQPIQRFSAFFLGM